MARPSFVQLFEGTNGVPRKGQGYRRTTDLPGIYLLMAQNGTLIDTFGYLRGMIPHVSLPFALEYDHPIHFLSDVGEDWNLYVHQLRDGIVVLGDRKEVSPEGINGLFASNADSLRGQHRRR